MEKSEQIRQALRKISRFKGAKKALMQELTVTRGTVNNWISGRSKPRDKHFLEFMIAAIGVYRQFKEESDRKTQDQRRVVSEFQQLIA